MITGLQITMMLALVTVMSVTMTAWSQSTEGKGGCSPGPQGKCQFDGPGGGGRGPQGKGKFGGTYGPDRLGQADVYKVGMVIPPHMTADLDLGREQQAKIVDLEKDVEVKLEALRTRGQIDQVNQIANCFFLRTE